MRILTIIFLFTSIKLFSQEIDYQLYVHNIYKDSIEKSIFYTLKKNDLEFNIEDFDNPIIKVPEKGKYKLISGETDEIYFVEITETHKSDTLILPSIEMNIIAHPPSFKNDISESELKKIRVLCRPVFISYGLPIDGNKIDYFTNNNIRLSGNFKNGYAIGEIKEYYQNGVIKVITRYDNDGLLIEKIEYDEKGIKIKK